MRTNIVLDEDVVREAMALSGEPTKKALVDRMRRRSSGARAGLG
jgi:Arc/MetJ family transcription regulator